MVIDVTADSFIVLEPLTMFNFINLVDEVPEVFRLNGVLVIRPTDSDAIDPVDELDDACHD